MALKTSKRNTNAIKHAQKRPDREKLYWIEYTGEKIVYYKGRTGDKTNPVQSYRATSGLTGLQYPSKQRESGGPLPSGDYRISLVPNPKRMAKVNKNSGELIPNPNGGIEQIPKSFTTQDGQIVIFPGWGTWRARLKPRKNTKKSKRNYFYLHNSHKGYTHGCIETGDELLSLLLAYRDKGHASIDVRVIYTDPTTYGGTDR